MGRQLSETSVLLCTCGQGAVQRAMQQGSWDRRRAVRLRAGKLGAADQLSPSYTMFTPAHTTALPCRWEWAEHAQQLTQGPQSPQSVPRSHCTSNTAALSGWDSGVAWALGLPSSQIPLFVKPAHVFSHTDLTAAGAGSEALLPPLLLPAPPPTWVNGSGGESGVLYTQQAVRVFVCSAAHQLRSLASQPTSQGN